MTDPLTAVEIRSWGQQLDRVTDRIGNRFWRPEIRHHAHVFLQALLSNVSRKNGWQLAEQAGDASPRNIQHFIGRLKWGSCTMGHCRRRVRK